MDFDVERVERLERRLRGWEVVVKGGLGVVIFGLTVRVGLRCMVLPYYQGLFEALLGPGSRYPLLSEWVMEVGKYDPVPAFAAVLLGLMGMVSLLWLPSRWANWVVLGCFAALLMAEVFLALGFELPLQSVVRLLPERY